MYPLYFILQTLDLVPGEPTCAIALTTLALVLGGLGLAGGLAGAGASMYSANKATNAQLDATTQTNEQNAALAREQMQWSEHQIDKQNEYNSPIQQMARYQAAGLNPNLIYGTGAASAGNQMALPSYQRAEMQTPDVLSGGFAKAQAALQLGQFIQQWQSSQADIALKKAQAASISQQTHQQSLITPEMVRENYNNKTALAEMQINEGTARTALLNKQAMHEAYKMLETQARTAHTDASKAVLNRQLDVMAKNMSYLDSVIALNEGKLSLQEFEKRYTTQQIAESISRCGLMQNQIDSSLANDVAAGVRKRDGSINSYAEATAKNLGRSLSNFSLTDLLPLGKLLKKAPKTPSGRKSTVERYGPGGEFLGATLGKYQDIY